MGRKTNGEAAAATTNSVGTLQKSQIFQRGLAGPDGGSEDVGVGSVVVPELEFIDVERQVLRRDFVESSYDTALHNAPKALDGVGVRGTNNIFPVSMAHDKRIYDRSKVSRALIS